MDILPANMSDTTPAGALAPSWRTHDWAQLSQTVDVGPDRLAYVDIGEGDPPVLLLHGLGGNWTAWLETLPSVALHRRTIAVDLPGFGASAPGSDGISITGYARTIERFCERMGLDEIVLAGSSLGGWVAAELTLRAPALVRGLILIDAAGIVPTRAERFKAVSIMRGAELGAPLAPRASGRGASGAPSCTSFRTPGTCPCSSGRCSSTGCWRPSCNGWTGPTASARVARPETVPRRSWPRSTLCSTSTTRGLAGLAAPAGLAHFRPDRSTPNLSTSP